MITTGPITGWGLSLAGVVAALATTAAPAQMDASDDDAPHVHARLALERTSLIAGRTNMVGVVLEIEDGWHVYADSRNDTGMATRVRLAAPEGWTVEEPVFPAPHRHVSGGSLLDHVYEGTLLVLVPVKVPSTAAGQDARLEASADWLVCKEVCVIGSAEGLALVAPVAASAAEPAPTPDAPLFRAARVRVARPMGTALGSLDAQVADDGDGPALTITAPGARRMAFYPDAEAPETPDLLAQGEAEGPRLVIDLEPGDAEAVSGTVEVWGPQDEPASRVYRVSVPLTRSSRPDGPGGDQ